MAMPTTTTSFPSYSLEEVAQHKSEGDAWIAIDGKVFDVTKFLVDHPGGKKILLNECGKDATKKFRLFHEESVLSRYGSEFQIGVLQDSASTKRTKETPSIREYGDSYGDMIPYGDPSWYQTFNSPYYTESHKKWRDMVRQFVEREMIPFVNDWEEDYRVPATIYQKAGIAGMLAGCVGHRWPTEYVGECPVENFNSFHTHILLDEVSRTASGGVIWAFFGGLIIGLPPIMNFGSDYLKQKVVRNCLLGKKVICLAISEPWAGSDVSGLKTTAKREGDYYIVNGAKKWITNGTFADYFTVAVRTGPAGSGQGGLSLLLCEKGMPGLSVRHMKCQGAWSSGTSFITFENVKVPVRNRIGEENKGFRMIMYNFNHERWALVVMANRLARTCLEESLKYSLKRKTFGNYLIEHQAIRMKISDMARQVEAQHAWTENITYQWDTMSQKDAMKQLGDNIALLKVQSTRVLELCAREAIHTFGGAGYVRGGVGEKVERIYRDVRCLSIPGGAEEILSDYAARTIAKIARKRQKAKL